MTVCSMTDQLLAAEESLRQYLLGLRGSAVSDQAQLAVTGAPAVAYTRLRVEKTDEGSTGRSPAAFIHYRATDGDGLIIEDEEETTI